MRSRPIIIALAASALAASSAAASEVRGKLLLGAYQPAAPKVAGPRAFNWELENGFKQVRKDRVAAAREIAVVLTGDGDAKSQERLEVDFSGGGILPSTIVMRQGSTLQLTNRDEIAHELYADGLERFKPEATSPKGRRSLNLQESGSWPLRDNLVSHVRGHLHVLPKLVAVAKVTANGQYSFANVEAGKYTLKVFHGAHELISQDVQVDGKVFTVDPLALTAPAPAK